MANSKRKPIDYSYGGGIFRPKEEVEREVQEPRKASDDQSAKVTSRKHGERTSERPNVRTDGIKVERLIVRHSFDIYQDQLHALKDVQASIYKITRKEPRLGELVRKAIDAYLVRENSVEKEESEETSE